MSDKSVSNHQAAIIFTFLSVCSRRVEKMFHELLALTGYSDFLCTKIFSTGFYDKRIQK